MWDTCKFHKGTDTEGYKTKANSRCKKGKVSVSVSMEKRDFGARRNKKHYGRSLSQTSIAASKFLLTCIFRGAK